MMALSVLLTLPLIGCTSPSKNTTNGDVESSDSGGVVALTEDTGEASSEEDEGGMSFARDIEPMMIACTGCHSGETPDGSFLLPIDGMYDAIVGRPSGQTKEMLMVTPGDSLYSYIWHKLNGSQAIAGGAGTAMPLGQRWSDEDVQRIADWIDLGAAP